MSVTRRTFLGTSLATGAVLAAGKAAAASDRAAIYKQIEQRHDEAVQRLQAWIRQPSIAAENRGVTEGCDLTMRMLRDAGFQHVEQRPTDGQPGIFARLDAGARRTFGLYFMYDVKQANPQEWSSPPWEAQLVDLPNLGKAVMGRGAVNQKGPQSAFLAALHAIRAAAERFRSTSCSSRKARRRSARRISRRSCSLRRCARRSRSARASSCPKQHRISTAM
jgi:hypothetical protein